MDNQQSTSIDISDDETTMEAKWEKLFEHILQNKNLSVKDLDTAKFVFYSGAAALVELMEDVRPPTTSMAHVVAASQALDHIKDEIAEFLHSDDDETDTLWVAVPSTKREKDEQTDS